MWRVMSFVLIGMLVLGAAPLMAQDNTPPNLGVFGVLVDGQTFSGSMKEEDAMHLYAFQGAANTTVTVNMTLTKGSLDPLLLMLGQEGELIGWDDDSGGNLNAQVTATLPDSGIYLVIASSLFALYQDGTSDIDGSYNIAISGAPTAPDQTALDLTKLNLTPVEWDSPLTALLDDEHPVFLAWLKVQDSIGVDANSPSSEVDTLMYVFDPDGKRIAIDDDSGADGVSAFIPSLPLTDPGQYLILVTTFDFHNANERGLQGGRFNLSVTRNGY